MNLNGKIVLLVFLAFVIFFVNPKNIFAEQSNQFITIVNPVRISSYNKNPLASLEAEYQVIFNNNLPATWLLTYDVLEDKSLINFLKKINSKQELGIFLEITPKFAQDSGIKYNDTGNWHHAGSVFLSGYKQEERKILIDKAFEEFKNIFGYYPTSVGSWWTDSFSLSYIKEKYNITANLGCSDQFSTDDYQIWGQYWSTPYYPSRYHNGIPATNEENKLDVVNLQWAPRDPLNGYYSSLYSSQDFPLTNERLGIDYFEKLINLYGKKHDNSFGQITVGLEADLDPEGYRGKFAEEMKIVKKLTANGEFQATTMKDFSNWYRNQFSKLSPSQKIETQDLLGKNKKVIWYQSPYYRIGVSYGNEETKIFDLRIYNQNIVEPYYLSPNKDFNLSIYIPSIFDEINNPGDVWKIKGDVQINFAEDSLSIKGNQAIPLSLTLSPAAKIEKKSDGTKIQFIDKWYSPKEGIVFKDFSSEATHFFKQKKAIFNLLLGRGWQFFKKIEYLIPQGELDALFKLSTLSAGKVVVYDKECLQCDYQTKIKPPAFGNKRDYVKKYGKHSIIYNSKIFEAKTREEGKRELDNLHAKYIYLVKFEGYQEKLPFSPGDYGVEKIFSNANAEIWRVK
jgi:hypothetical protein